MHFTSKQFINGASCCCCFRWLPSWPLFTWKPLQPHMPAGEVRSLVTHPPLPPPPLRGVLMTGNEGGVCAVQILSLIIDIKLIHYLRDLNPHGKIICEVAKFINKCIKYAFLLPPKVPIINLWLLPKYCSIRGCAELIFVDFLFLSNEWPSKCVNI